MPPGRTIRTNLPGASTTNGGQFTSADFVKLAKRLSLKQNNSYLVWRPRRRVAEVYSAFC